MRFSKRTHAHEHGEKRSGLGRRRFLGGVGASGLATAAVVFGGQGSASASYPLNCCSLCFAPSISVASCKSYSNHYIWRCSNGAGTLHCQCCETKKPGCPSGVKSAGSCQYG